MWRIPQGESCGELPAGFAPGVPHRQTILQIRGKRLLTKDVLSRLERGNRLLRMPRVPGSDHDPLTVGRKEGIQRLAHHPFESGILLHSAYRFLVGIVQAREFDPVGLALDQAGEVSPHSPTADEPDTYRCHGQPRQSIIVTREHDRLVVLHGCRIFRIQRVSDLASLALAQQESHQVDLLEPIIQFAIRYE